jgi:hypothetical protein
LEQISKRAKKLRQLLIELDGVARLDLLSVAGRYSGNATSVDHLMPDKWLLDAGKLIRDVGVCAGAANKDLRRQARPGGRPKHMAERLLIWDLAELYRKCGNRMPGYSGHFPKVVRFVFERIDPTRDNTGLDHVIKEIIQDFKRTHAK